MMNNQKGISNFDVQGEPTSIGQRWQRWRRGFELFLDSKGEMSANQKRGLLLHNAGQEVQDIYFTLDVTYPDGSDVYEETIKKLHEYFVPRENVAYEKYQFRSMSQLGGESIDQFVTRLRQQAQKCGFSGNMESEIRDQVIEKCYDSELRRKLIEELSLDENKVTLKRVSDVARAWEMANRQANEMGTKKVQTINRNSRGIDTIRNVNGYQGACYRCGRKGHMAKDGQCPARGQKCNKCGIVGHFGVVCKTKEVKKRGKSYRSYAVDQEDKYTVDQEDKYAVDQEDKYAFMISALGNLQNNGEEIIPVQVGGVEINMMIDSGASCCVINQDLWEECKQKGIQCISKKMGDKLQVYGGKDALQVVGTFWADVSIKEKMEKAQQFVVIKEGGIPILGKQCALKLGVLKLGLNLEVSQVTENRGWKQQYPEVFRKEIGQLKNYELKIPIDVDIAPVVQGVRRIPYSLREPLEKLLKEYLEGDIIEPVKGPTSWVSPVVLTPKKSGGIRMCVDMRRANEAVRRERYPLPTVEEILQDLNQSKWFSRLDIKDAYHQIVLHPESREITTFSTHLGMFRFKRLMFGVSCAPEMFQKIVKQLLQGCSGVFNFLDDIIVYGESREQHDRNLQEVLKELQERGIVLNEDKCEFQRKDIEFLGHHISREGVKPNKGNVQAVEAFREPRTPEEVMSFLGLVNYCARFIPDLATINAPLRRVTKKTEKFVFNREQREAFNKLKQKLIESPVLGFYDKNAETKVFTDASPVGLGAVLIQIQKGEPRIISYASRSLSEVEKRYSQTEKEALGIVWACERFYLYLYGRKFDLYTDHRPLEFIYSRKSKPCARVERWVLRLQSYDYTIKYIPGKSNIADVLSRLSPQEIGNRDKDEGYVRWVALKATPQAMTMKEIEKASELDPTLIKVREGLKRGYFEEELKVYRLIQTELCVEGKLVLRGTRILIPESCKQRILEIGHEGHPGVVSMKQRLRTKVWWYQMDKGIEEFVKRCQGCQLVSRTDPPEPMARTILPERPWTDVAVDLMGPLPSGEHLLVVVDYYSRYVEVEIMEGITSKEVLDGLQTILARHGIPETMYSDNGGQFIGRELMEFAKLYGIKWHWVTPRYPQANGQVERQNRSILKRLKIATAEGKPWKEELIQYLMMYRATPHSVTGMAPGEMLFNRKIKTKLPEWNARMMEVPRDEEVRDWDAIQKEKGKTYADSRHKARPSEIEEGDTVLLKQLRKDKLTTPFGVCPQVVTEKNGNAITVRSPEGRKTTRNSTWIKKYYASPVSQLEGKEEEDKRVQGPQEEKGEGVEEDRPEGRPQRHCGKPLYLKDYVLDGEIKKEKKKKKKRK